MHFPNILQVFYEFDTLDLKLSTQEISGKNEETPETPQFVFKIS